jgi:hypothetical protein
MSWSNGFAHYVETGYEVRLHKRKDTYGGMLWPEPSPDRLLEIALAALDKASANTQ